MTNRQPILVRGFSAAPLHFEPLLLGFSREQRLANAKRDGPEAGTRFDRAFDA
jgi:hypothetical protein